MHTPSEPPLCRQEILGLPRPPACLFGDQLDFLPDRLQAVARNTQHKNHTNAYFEKCLPYAPAKEKAWCLRHGKECSARAADWHTAGPHCTDHSSFGKGQKEEGGKARFALAWMGHRRTLLEQVVVHENV
eukprot:15431618-Alexandrium_andersonii.AAC.2